MHAYAFGKSRKRLPQKIVNKLSSLPCRNLVIRSELKWFDFPGVQEPVKPRHADSLALFNRVEGEPKPAPVKRPRDGPSVACSDLRRFT
jgi:hypothetical protein